VLAAGARAAAEMDANLFLIGSALGFELFHEEHHPVLRLGDGQIADSMPVQETQPCRKFEAAMTTHSRRVPLEGREIFLGDVEQDQVLLVRRGDQVHAGLRVFLRQLGDLGQLLSVGAAPAKQTPIYQRPGCFCSWTPR